MQNEIEVRLMKDAEDFIDKLDFSIREKIFFNINKTTKGFKGEWFEKMKGTDELFEFRTLYRREYIRLFAFWDRRDNKKTLIICTHGLIKKTNKTPAAEIDYAEKLRKEYFAE